MSAQKHLAAAAYAAHALPFETFLLAMLLEEHKEMLRMRLLLEGAGMSRSSPRQQDPRLRRLKAVPSTDGDLPC